MIYIAMFHLYLLNHYIKDIEYANIQLKDNNVYTEDGTLVEDNMIMNACIQVNIKTTGVYLNS